MNNGLWVLIGLAIFGAGVLVIMGCVSLRHKLLFEEHIVAERRNRRESLEERIQYRETVLMNADEATQADAGSLIDSKAALRLSGLMDIAVK